MRQVTLLSVSISIPTIIYLYKYIQKCKRRQFPFVYQPINRQLLDQLPPLKNDLLLRALRGQPVDRVPVWMMRQAGRHLPEFKLLRELGYDFFTMCTVPELAVEVTLQPYSRYQTDAVILFSDILVVLQAAGMKVKMVSKVGPVVSPQFDSPSNLLEFLNLDFDIEEKLGYVLDIINLTRQKIMGQVPVIGFCGGPMTLLMYAVGGKDKTFSKLRKWLYQYPTEMKQLLYGLSAILGQYLVAQAHAGAQVVQIFETTAVDMLTQVQYFEFVYPYLKQIIEIFKEKVKEVPIICFSKGTPYAYEMLAQTGYDCLSVDWQINRKELRQKLASYDISIQGNLDPMCIYADHKVIQEEVKTMINEFGTKGYIANFGHGCSPDMDPIHVMEFVRNVKEISKAIIDKK